MWENSIYLNNKVGNDKMKNDLQGNFTKENIYNLKSSFT